jgi:ApbE superfamily uncharacterized protein (UPF0280 family)
MYKARTYRSLVKDDELVSFEIIERETDLFISAGTDLSKKAREAVLNYRRDIEEYIKRDPDFYSALEPVKLLRGAPEIIIRMARASEICGVGPMAAVAGAMAGFVGSELVPLSDEVIVENGGDIFIKTLKTRTIGIYAGENSPFTGKLSISAGPAKDGIGVCTSSGTVSHSLSFGKADAVTIMSADPVLSDAAATAVANIVKSKEDIEKAIGKAKTINGIEGVLVIIGDRLGSWGSIKLV